MIIVNSNKIEVSLCEASYFEAIGVLSYSYYLARYNEMDLFVDVFWSSHYVDNNFYFNNWDETESFLDKFNYLHSMIELKSKVSVKFNHIIIDDFDEYLKRKKQFNDDCISINEIVKVKGVDKRSLLWPLKNHLDRDPKKIVFWKTTFVHSMMGTSNDVIWVTDGRETDELYSYTEWNKIKENLKMLDYNVIEVEYRTPIRELYYHLATSEFAFGYNGLCQSVGISLGTPTILTNWKKSSNLNYDHLLPKVSVDMFKDKRYIDQNVQIAKEKISKFRDFYVNFFGE